MLTRKTLTVEDKIEKEIHITVPAGSEANINQIDPPASSLYTWGTRTRARWIVRATTIKYTVKDQHGDNLKKTKENKVTHWAFEKTPPHDFFSPSLANVDIGFTPESEMKRNAARLIKDTHKLKLKGTHFVDPDPANKFDAGIANGGTVLSLAGHKIVSSIRRASASVVDKVIANNDGKFVFADVQRQGGKVVAFRIDYQYTINTVSP